MTSSCWRSRPGPSPCRPRTRVSRMSEQPGPGARRTLVSRWTLAPRERRTARPPTRGSLPLPLARRRPRSRTHRACRKPRCPRARSARASRRHPPRHRSRSASSPSSRAPSGTRQTRAAVAVGRQQHRAQAAATRPPRVAVRTATRPRRSRATRTAVRPGGRTDGAAVRRSRRGVVLKVVCVAVGRHRPGSRGHQRARPMARRAGRGPRS